MASTPRTTSTKTVEKRKREKSDLDGASQKKKRKHKKDEKETDDVKPTTERRGDIAIVENGVTLDDDATSSIFARKTKLNGEVSQNTKNKSAAQTWRISEPMGGRMADVDPIFTADEE